MPVVHDKGKGLRKHTSHDTVPLKGGKVVFGWRRLWWPCSSQVLHKRALWYPVARDAEAVQGRVGEGQRWRKYLYRPACSWQNGSDHEKEELYFAESSSSLCVRLARSVAVPFLRASTFEGRKRCCRTGVVSFAPASTVGQTGTRPETVIPSQHVTRWDRLQDGRCLPPGLTGSGPTWCPRSFLRGAEPGLIQLIPPETRLPSSPNPFRPGNKRTKLNSSKEGTTFRL